MAHKIKKAKRKTVRKALKARPGLQASAVDVQVPEKRSVNFFVRVKQSNADWVKAQARAMAVNYSEYLDLLIESIKAPQLTPNA